MCIRDRNIAVLFFRTKLFDLGYAQGAKLITTMKDQLAYVTNGASILGLIVVGALIPSVIKLKIPYTFQSGEVSLSVQENLDKIMPYLPQVILVLPVSYTHLLQLRAQAVPFADYQLERFAIDRGVCPCLLYTSCHF